MGALQSGVPQGTKPSNRSGQIRGVAFNTKVCPVSKHKQMATLLFGWGRLSYSSSGSQTPSVLETVLELLTPLLLPPRCWDCRHVLPTPFSDYCFKNLSCF